jgi:tyrosine-protein kinase Etk/Wzc
MNTEKSNNSAIDRYSEAGSNIDLKRLVRVLWSRWYWIVGAVLLALLACFIFLKVSKPRYVASVTLRYNEKKTELDELNKLIQPDGFGNQEYLTEKYVIESEEVINGAIALLKTPFTFKKKGAFRDDDVYPYQPFTAQVISYDKTEFGNGKFQLLQNGIISYATEDGNEEKRFDLAKDTLITVNGFAFKITSIQNLDDQYIFNYNDLESVKKAVDNKIDVKEPERNLPILELSFTYNNQKFTQDFLNKLLASYEDYNLAQKRRSSDLTIRFIQDQIKLYSNSLRQASSKVADFKQRNSVPSLQTSMAEVMNKMAELETQKSTIEIGRSYINLLEDNLSNRFETINIGNVGLDATSDVVLVKLINELNAVILKRKDALIKNFSVNSQQVKALDEEVERIRNQVLGNIRVQKQKNESVLQMVTQNINTLKGRVGSLPEVERQLLYLESDRAVTDKIYSLLLNREIEASIVKAGILPSFNVLTRNDAYKVYPQALQVILICFFVGLIAGLGSIFLTRYLNGKFIDVGKIGQNESVNLLGILNRYPEKIANSGEDITNFLDNRSLFSESVNGIRTNLSFMAGNESSKKGKLLVVTSEISGEGKSFTTVNLAISLSKTGKKVLIIVSDLRRSKLHRFFNNNNKTGLSSYLSGKVTEQQKVISHSVIEGLDYIPAGPVPFNPTELIQNPRFEQLIEDCQQRYDYVIVDTAPVGLVSDNIPLLKHSDLVIFIIRWMYSNREAYMLPDQLAAEYDLKAVGVIVNDFYKDDLYASLAPASYYASRGYGNHYKYSYDYYGKTNNYYADDKPKPFWHELSLKKLFKRK